MSPSPPAWLRGPAEGIPPLLQPVAHALIEAGEDVARVLSTTSAEVLWSRPEGAASAGFHVRHAIGSLDRLFTYARGDALSETQLATLAAEQSLDASAGTPDELARDFAKAVERALEQLRHTDERELLEPREVGRARLPSNVLGLLAHAGDHTCRHVGQLITTVRVATARQDGGR